ncbi:uncharacterized protein [Diabrotica undecimpunctata]|uniref:uncharacterized protein n=1 Tax=Diabrotica undecimpunctata TaxID=50387 RepID=UPI003B633BF3
MHIFVDASEHASACVAYLRIMKKDVIECTLIGAKTHVAPLKPQTIPRLELNGAVMGSRFAKSLCQHLSITVHNIVYWTDSSTVLSWLRDEDPRKLPKYVAYRVAEIQQNSMISHWRYVPTKNNIADEATKWTKRPNLKNTRCWFKGPDFLYQLENSWPPDITLKKEKPEEILTSHELKFNSPRLIDFERFSQFNRILRATAYMFRFLRIVYAKLMKSEEPKGILTSEELLGARNILIKQTQCEYFKNEIKQLKTNNSGSLEKIVNTSNSLYKLSPYLDEDGLLRIRGRLDEARDVISETKRPIILPRGSRLTLLIIEDYHKRYHHRNHEIVVNEIRQKFYIPKLRQLVKKIRTNCQNCKVKFAKPKPPEMSPLPPCRLATFTAPFTHTGMDYFGPINVTVGRRTEKRWGALFTCLTTRAVHLEVAYKLDVDSFILCLTNFINRRGRPRHIYCDRGTNFIAAERVLKEELQKVDSKLIANSLISPELKFHFNAPLSPHMGGAWERLVKAVKISLYDSLPSRNPTDQLLYSCLIAAENIVNSRPLTYLPIESEESESLTPNHFLIGSSNGDKPIGFLNEDVKVFKFNYLYREQFANKCWRRFISEYIPELLLRAKWHKQVVPIK